MSQNVDIFIQWYTLFTSPVEYSYFKNSTYLLNAKLDLQYKDEKNGKVSINFHIHSYRDYSYASFCFYKYKEVTKHKLSKNCVSYWLLGFQIL